MKHVFAHTSACWPNPDYVSVAADDQTEYFRIAVRSAGSQTASETHLTRAQAIELAQAILATTAVPEPA